MDRQYMIDVIHKHYQDKKCSYINRKNCTDLEIQIEYDMINDKFDENDIDKYDNETKGWIYSLLYYKKKDISYLEKGIKLGNKYCFYYWGEYLWRNNKQKESFDFFMKSDGKENYFNYITLGNFYKYGQFCQTDEQLAYDYYLKFYLCILNELVFLNNSKGNYDSMFKFLYERNEKFMKDVSYSVYNKYSKIEQKLQDYISNLSIRKIVLEYY